jgi:hypothetical protein
MPSDVTVGWKAEKKEGREKLVSVTRGQKRS